MELNGRKVRALSKTQCICAGISALTMLAIPAYSQVATDTEMALSALRSEVRTQDPEKIGTVIDDVRQTIADKVASDTQKTETIAAKLVFSHGLTAALVEELSERYDFEVTSAEAKIPTGDNGVVTTMGIGARTLLLLEGPLKERLALASGAQQLEVLSLAQLNKDDAAIRATTQLEARYYKIGVVGGTGNIFRLYDDPEIAGIFLEPAANVASYEQLRSSISSMKTNGSQRTVVRLDAGERLEDKLPPGVSPGQLINPYRLPSLTEIPSTQGKE